MADTTLSWLFKFCLIQNARWLEGIFLATSVTNWGFVCMCFKKAIIIWQVVSVVLRLDSTLSWLLLLLNWHWMGPSPVTNSILSCLLFCEKSLICVEGKSMTPHFWGHWFSFGPYSDSSLSISYLIMAFWDDTKPFKLTSFIAFVATEKQGPSQVCHTRYTGTWTLSKTTDANLDCVFVKTHFFTMIPDGKKGNRLELS